MSDSPLKKAIDEMTPGPMPVHINCACDPALQGQVSAAQLRDGVDYEIDVSPHTDFATGKMLPPGMLGWRIRPCDPPSPDLTIEKP